MKTKIALLVFGLFFGDAAYALTPVWGNRGAGECDGQEYVAEVDRASILALPAWKPGEADPKIGPGAAWKLAHAKAKSILPNIDKYKTARIALERIGSNDEVRYIYQVWFIDYHSTSREIDGMRLPNCLIVWVSTEGKVFGLRPKQEKGDDLMF